ncbi:hypothetical protein Tco_0167269 [Tanacetum coccineum]
MLEDFSSNAKDKRTYVYTLLVTLGSGNPRFLVLDPRFCLLQFAMLCDLAESITLGSEFLRFLVSLFLACLGSCVYLSTLDFIYMGLISGIIECAIIPDLLLLFDSFNDCPTAFDEAQEIPDEFLGELTFFLGLQVKQRDDGIFISQDKYVADIFKKFDFFTMKTASTPIETNKALLKDEEAKNVDVHLYRSMIGSLMYLTASRPDIIFAVYACARFQVTSKVLHLHGVKRIFRYLKGNLQAGGEYEDKDKDFEDIRRSPYNDKDTKDIRRYS